MQEWIRLHRSFLNWDWLDKPEMLALFMHLLSCASEEDKQGDLAVYRGQFKTSLNQLSDTTNLSKKTIRTCLSKLKDWNLIQIESNNRYSIIIICNYDDYFSKAESQAEKKVESKEEKVKSEEAKEEKPKKTKEEIIAATEKRKDKFYKELVPYVETYGRVMIRAFFDYWSETNKSGSQMKFEQQRTWNLNLRLQRWGRQQTGYQGKTSSTALHNSENKDYNEGGW